jgi:transcriptional regulator with GAF, ATPase, and Fis domain
VQLNCAAFPETMLEAELFGYERGAFTGAVAAKAGLFESADGGTVFLDEVGEMPLATQAKLLRVLETGDVMRLGNVRSRHVDVRFIAATNRDLRRLIAQGRFRADLFFRLNGMSVHIPPLRQRPLDVLPLAHVFAHKALQKLGGGVPTFHPEAERRLAEHSWPGNVRELKNVIERAVALSRGRTIDVDHVVLEEDDGGMLSGGHPSGVLPAPMSFDPELTGRLPSVTTTSPRIPLEAEVTTTSALRDELKAMERDRIVDALKKCGGNQSQAAKVLGISRYTLISRIEQYGLERPRKRIPPGAPS